MKSWKVGTVLALMLAMAVFSCGGGKDSALADGDTEAEGETLVDGDGGESDADGESAALDLSASLAPGEVRAGRITREAELIGGPMAKGKIGDYKLYNSRIRILVEGLRESDGWGCFGGTIADADIVRPAGETGASLFSEYFFSFGMRMQNPETVEVVNDGRNGLAAVLRFIGPDRGLPLMDAVLTGIIKPTLLNTPITVDYVLPPDSDLLEIRSSFKWQGSSAVDLDYILQIFILGDGLKNFRVGSGFDKNGHGGPTDIYVSAGDRVSYGFFSQEGPIRQLINYEGVNFYRTDKRRINPGETVSFVRYMAVAAGGVDPVLRIHRAWTKATGLGKVHGLLRAADGTTPLAGAHIHVIDPALEAGKNYVDQAVTDATGHYSLELPAGAYTIIPFVDGCGSLNGQAVSVAADQDKELDLTLPAMAQLSFTVTDTRGEALPCKIFADRTGGALLPPETFGEFLWHGGHQWVVHSESGMGTISLPAGDYTISASRGYEYSLVTTPISLSAGQKGVFTASLDRVIDTTGFVSSDFHLHSKASQDSDVSFEDRIRSAVSEGLEVPISTDHDIIVDWMPAASSLGVTAWVHPITGLEITTCTFGHFNVWPLVADPSKLNNGAYSWYEKSAPDLFSEVAKTDGHPILTVNHPRTVSIGGYFNAVRFDADTGTFGSPEKWSPEFDTIEIINGNDLTTALETSLPDWYSFLNRGFRFVGSSGTDNHKLTNEVGAVRNWIASSSDDPATIDPFELAANVRAMKLIVSNGPFLTFSIGAAGLGETVTDTDGKVALKLKVQAPTYMDVRKLTVIGNGVAAKDVDLTGLASAETPEVRYDATIELTPAIDTWYIVIVEGDNGFAPISGKRAFAFTNPIFVDVDGNGIFDAPEKGGATTQATPK